MLLQALNGAKSVSSSDLYSFLETYQQKRNERKISFLKFLFWDLSSLEARDGKYCSELCLIPFAFCNLDVLNSF